MHERRDVAFIIAVYAGLVTAVYWLAVEPQTKFGALLFLFHILGYCALMAAIATGPWIYDFIAPRMEALPFTQWFNDFRAEIETYSIVRPMQDSQQQWYQGYDFESSQRMAARARSVASIENIRGGFNPAKEALLLQELDAAQTTLAKNRALEDAANATADLVGPAHPLYEVHRRTAQKHSILRHRAEVRAILFGTTIERRENRKGERRTAAVAIVGIVIAVASFLVSAIGIWSK